MLKGFHHTGLTVKDIDRSVSWYCGKLGFTVHTTFEVHGFGIEQITGMPGAHLKGTHLRLEDYFLELLQYIAPSGRDVDQSTNNVGNAHVAFLVEDIFQSYQELRAKGVHFIGSPARANPARPLVCYFLDPDGITLELVQRPE